MAPPPPPLHALVIPHPLQGHITPLLQFSRKLSSSHGFSISFIVTQHFFDRSFASRKADSLPITFIALPDGLPLDHPRRSTFLDAYEAITGMQEAVEHFIHQLGEEGRLPTCIIADTFAIWAHEVACKFGIPRVAFVTTNATALSVMSSVLKLVSLGLLPLKTLNGSSKYSDEPITCIPGVPSLLPKDLPVSMQSPSLTHYRLQFVMNQFKDIHKAAGILVNSVYELESRVIDAMQLEVPVYAIGPTLLLNGESTDPTGTEMNMWPEQNDCLLWLDKQAPNSVLYVSFGSMASLELVQLCELALGLDASQQPFLWVIRPDSVEGSISDVLPPGFVDRTKDRGTIISWAPQLHVLSHFAIGGFLTHCGWNSTLENICLGGVPMICWPDAAEQRLNSRLIVSEWKVGLEFCKEEDGIVYRREVEMMVRSLMQGEEGREMRSRIAGIKDIARRSIQEGGSSLRNIEAFVEGMERTKISKPVP